MTRVAIIGAGLSGLTLARLLAARAEVVVFEKSRGVGGRMATRRCAEFSFDHGAQYFTARSLLFRQFLQDYRARGVVQEWLPQVLTLVEQRKPWKRDWFEPHFVGVPGMTALCKALAEGIELQTDCRISALVRDPSGRKWTLLADDAEIQDEFDWVLCTAPAAQTGALLPPQFSGHAALADIHLEPCIALLLGLAEVPRWRFDAARIRHPVLDWISCERSRPGRGPAFGVTLHSSAQWAQQQYAADDEQVAALMLAALGSVLESPLPEVALQQVKRWRYAKAASREEPLLLLDPALQVAACGDWCRDGRVEGAFLAAHDLASALQPWL